MNAACESNPSDQSGAFLLPFICAVVTAWVAFTLLARVVPIYLEHRTIVAVLEATAATYDPDTQGKSDIRKALRKRWMINGIDQSDSARVVIDIKRSSVTLSHKYTADFPIAGPISGVWTFNDVVSNR